MTSSPYGQPPYGWPGQGSGYGRPDAYGYGPGHGPMPWGPQSPFPSRPYGPGRPRSATAAAVLGIVTGGLTALVVSLLLLAVVGGDGDANLLVLLVGGAPCAAGTITGGIRLLGRHRRGPLLVSAVASAAVLVLALLVGLVVYDGEDAWSFALVMVCALPLPVVTAILAARKPVEAWTEGRPPY